MSVKLFPVHLASSLAEYLHKLLCHTVRTRGLVCGSVISHWGWSISLIHTVYLLVISIIVKAFFYIPYECFGSLHRCYDGSGTSVGLQIVLLLPGRSLAGVFLSDLSHILLAMLVYLVQCPGLVVVGFRLGSHPASLRLVRPGAIKQGLCFQQICQKIVV